MEALKQSEDGKWFAEIDPGDGSAFQRFSGDSQNEVVQQLIKAQSHATRKIREQSRLIKTSRPEVAKERSIDLKPRELTADERFKISHELANPAANAEAIRTVIEAEFGAPIEDVRSILKTVTQNQQRERFANEAARFINAYPDYYKVQENEKLIFEYLESRNMDFTANNLSIAYEDLSGANLLKVKTTSVAPPSVARPRSMSTGLPSSGTPRPATKSVGLTANEIYRMTPIEYKRRFEGDPQFRLDVEKVFSAKK